MGVCKLVDAVLFIYFLFMAISTMLFHSDIFLPSHFFPNFLMEAKSWYLREYEDYLFIEKPHFLVGLVGVELLVQWPLSVANVYAIIAKKYWYSTTCLIQGVSTFTSMAAILLELIGSKKASNKLLMIYYPFLPLSLVLVLRGLVPVTRNTKVTKATREAVEGKKRI
ncbi:hypothetical protein IFM89_005664 [Coptis chinensis]|uniref:EXPERA domain-containing protein n=1 Tax=Coptis chinensis TaxID=261450 RepID=A0A835GUV3_9MAGN|nr:hypothetical protein IFM89_005664 [Coptis chinensis]